MSNIKFGKYLIVIIIGCLSGYHIVYIQAVAVHVLLMSHEWIQQKALIISIEWLNPAVNLLYGIIAGWVILKFVVGKDRLLLSTLLLTSFVLVNFLVVICSGIDIRWFLLVEYLAVIIPMILMLKIRGEKKTSGVTH